MLIIGHRGAKDLAPENTIASLKKALEFNVDMIEFDIRVSKDGVPVLNHSRGAKGSPLYIIKRTTYAKMKQLKPDLATLEETLSFIDGRVPLYIEVKPWVNITPVVPILRKYKGKYFLGSKNQVTLMQLQKALPDIPKIVIEAWSGVIATRRARQVGTKIIAMKHQFLWSGFIKIMSKRGYTLYVYTLNRPAKAKYWQKFGLSGVVTNRPDLFKHL